MKKHGLFYFTEIFERTDRRTVYHYDDEWFAAPSSVPNPHLRTMSLNMSMAFFPSARRGDDYKKCIMNAEELLTDLRFDHFQVNPDYEREPDTESLGIGIAHRRIETSAGKASLIMINFRGAGYGDEWASNIILGKEGPAEGFAKGRDAAIAFLREYMLDNENIFLDRIKFWISGYSRVAAIANLLGAFICDRAEEFHTAPDDIFVYTFESPCCSDYRDTARYDCIHNTVNPFDLIPLIPPKEWGFSRYGHDEPLPAGGSDLCNDNLAEMKRRLYDLNPDVPYMAEDFKPIFQYGGGLVPMEDHRDLTGRARPEEWWFDRLQDQYLEKMVHFMALHIVKGSDRKPVTREERRRQFAEYNQPAFSEGARFYFGTSFEKRDGMRQTLHAVGTEDLSFRQRAFLYVLLWLDNPVSYRIVRSYLGKILLKRVENIPNADPSAEELVEFGKVVKPLMFYFIRAASRDVRRYRFAYMSTLLENLDRITGAHCPEVTLAWLQTLDDQY